MNKLLASVAVAAVLSATAAFAADEPMAAPGTTPTAMEAPAAAAKDTTTVKKHVAKKHSGKKHHKKADAPAAQ